MGKKWQRKDRQPGNLQQRRNTATSTTATPHFFDGSEAPFVPPTQNNKQVVLHSSAQPHAQSSTWKSAQSKDKVQYDRLRNLVRHIAPEMVKSVANDGEACDIFPRTYNEWCEHRAAMKDMEKDELMREIEYLPERRKAAAAAGTITSNFADKFGKDGKENKNLQDNRSAVLGQKSIWTQWYEPEFEHPTVPWPGTSERTWNGDGRVNANAKTQCGRFPALPRIPTDDALAPSQWPVAKQWAMDQVGPVLDNGPPASEVLHENLASNGDMQFEYDGARALGDSMMEELGDKQAEWLRPAWSHDMAIERRDRKASLLTLKPVDPTSTNPLFDSIFKG